MRMCAHALESVSGRWRGRETANVISLGEPLELFCQNSYLLTGAAEANATDCFPTVSSGVRSGGDQHEFGWNYVMPLLFRGHRPILATAIEMVAAN